MGTGAEIALVALTAASTAYAAKKASEKPDIPAPLADPKLPVAPTMDINVQNQMAQQQARSAGGTLLSQNQGEGTGQGANPGNQPRKSLLGT